MMQTHKIFKLKWGRMVYQLLPSFLRTRPLWALGYALIGSAVALDTKVDKYAAGVFYRLIHTPKRLHIEKVLNDQFDSQIRRIRVENSQSLEPVWFAKRLQDRPIWFPSRLKAASASFGGPFFKGEYYNIRGVDFVILLPTALKTVDPIALRAWEGRLRGQTDYYKEPDKTYHLQWTD